MQLFLSPNWIRRFKAGATDATGISSLIASDILAIMTYYEDVGGPKLAEEFYSELRQFFQNAANNPKLTAFASGISGA
jgi:plasmid stabilization system protein ParE